MLKRTFSEPMSLVSAVLRMLKYLNDLGHNLDIYDSANVIHWQTVYTYLQGVSVIKEKALSHNFIQNYITLKVHYFFNIK